MSSAIDSGIWTPQSLSDKVLWVKSDTGVTGSPISAWADQSGLSNNLEQSGADSAKPTLLTNQLNGYPAVVFDGVANTMRTANFGLAQPTTIFFIGKQITWTSGDSLFDGTIDNSGRLFQNSSSPRLDQYAGAFGANSSALAIDTFALITCIFNGASSILQINDIAESTGNPGATAMGGFVLGSFATGATAFSNISVCEIVVQNVVASSDQRTLMKTYATEKYGL